MLKMSARCAAGIEAFFTRHSGERLSINKGANRGKITDRLFTAPYPLKTLPPLA
jgi:hypothetical protein